MKFSLFLPQFKEPGTSDPYAKTFALATIAEDAGFDTATIGHHHFIRGNISDPLMFMAAVAVRTTRLRVGTGIYLLAVHNPIGVAEQVALLDQLSGGRVTLGVGTGWSPLEYEVFGSNIHERGPRIDECLRILRKVWTEENVSWDGEYYRFPTLTVYPRPVQQPRPPLWVAGVADAAIDRAARLGDAWICGPVQSLSKVKQCLGIYQAACERHHTGPDWILQRFAWLGTSRAQVESEILPGYVDGLLEHWRESAEDDAERELFARIDAQKQTTPAEIAADRLLWGGPDDFIEQINRYRKETGIEHVYVAFGSGMPGGARDTGTYGTWEQHRDMVSLFGREVIPAFS